jgi:hypothetical protein
MAARSAALRLEGNGLPVPGSTGRPSTNRYSPDPSSRAWGSRIPPVRSGSLSATGARGSFGVITSGGGSSRRAAGGGTASSGGGGASAGGSDASEGAGGGGASMNADGNGGSLSGTTTR